MVRVMALASGNERALLEMEIPVNDPNPPDEIRFGKVVIRPIERQLIVAGELVKLGARAFDVLLVLVQNKDHLVSHNELFQRVWPGLVVEENNLAVQISALRKLLGPEMIVNIPGRGYRFMASQDPTHAGPKPAHWARGLWINIAVIVVLAVVYITVDQVVLQRGATFESSPPGSTVEPSTTQSVAVLPFTDMSEKQDQEYFADGLSEEVMDLLSRVPNLHVAARTSAFSFKGKSDDIPTIARKLRVANILEGSVRKSGNSLRITVQLVRADSGYRLWSQNYDRKYKDIFQVQNDIAAAVVLALQISLLQEAFPRNVGTSNIEAYTLYLQARSAYFKGGPLDRYRETVATVQRALERDPGFAPSWSLLSRTFSLIADTFTSSPLDWEGARQAAIKALDLDPALPDAHCAMAKVLIAHDWNWDAGLTQARQALAIDPGNALALTWVGHLELIMGHVDQAINIFRYSVAADPLNAYRNEDLFLALDSAGRLDEALAAADRRIALNSTLEGNHYLVGLVRLEQGHPAQALAEMLREANEASRMRGQALAYHALGRRTEAESMLTEVEKRFGKDGPYLMAQIHAFRGEIDPALAWLERALEQRDSNCAWMGVDPLLANLRADPRYSGVLRRMNLPI
jgi:TolB-like protein/DNA-binding winged helix-turn-helix (wHTH) protein